MPRPPALTPFRWHAPPGGRGALAAGVVAEAGADCLAGRRLGHHALVYLLDGGGWFSDQGTPPTRVDAGDALLLFPGVRHGYGRGDQARWSEFWMVLGGRLWQALEDDGLLDRRQPVWHLGPDPGLAEDCLRLAGDLGRGLDPHTAAARAHLLLAAMHRRRTRPPAPGGGAVAAACAILAQDLAAPPDWQALAGSFGLSGERFRKLFAAATGDPPERWRMRRRIDRAKELLLLPGTDLAAVAAATGFCDRYHFSRRFRALAGTSPAAWRRAHA
jgi:AraC-like DNA-binding protein